jgi:hypothetical protein
MQIGTIVHISSRGIVDVQLADRLVHAQILSGGGHPGDLVLGLMKPGVCSWTNPTNRRMVVDVLA